MTNAMLNPSYRQQLKRTLSKGGKYRVIFVHQPEFPDVFEFITPPYDDGLRIRYINMDARPGANISQFVEG